MKKIIALAALAAVTLTANAQYTPEKGDVSVEVGFNPFSNNFQTFRIDELKMRYFLNNKSALRLRVGFDVTSGTRENTYTNVPSTTVITPGTTPSTVTTESTDRLTTTKTKDWMFNVFAGYEHHFDLSSRIKAYIGGEVGYEGTGGSETVDVTENKAYKSVYTSTSPAYTRTYTTNTDMTSTKETLGNNGYNALIVNVFTGVDFYVFKGLYLGAELGISFNNRSYKNPETTYSENKTTKTNTVYSNSTYGTNSYGTTVYTKNTDKSGATTEVTTISGSNQTTTTTTTTGKDFNKQTSRSETNFKLYVQPALRIGWTF